MERKTDLKRILSLIVCLVIVFCGFTACDQEKDANVEKENVVENNSEEMLNIWVPSFVESDDFMYEFQYDDYRLERIICEHKGETAEYLYSYNENGHFTEMTIKVADGESDICNYSYEYDGRHVSIDDGRYGIEFDEFGRFFQFKYIILQESQLNEEIQNIDHVEEFQYDDLGKLISIESYDDGIMSSQTQYSYDNQGRRIRVQVYNKSELYSEKVYEYDEQDRVVKEIERRRGLVREDIVTGEICEGEWETRTIVYKFNDKAGIMELKQYNSENELVTEEYIYEKIEVTPEGYEILKVNNRLMNSDWVIYEEQSGIINY